MVWILDSGCRCEMLWCDLDLTSHLVVVTLNLKILAGLNLRNCNMDEVDSWQGLWARV